jgi:glucan phosphorylase
MKRTLEAMDGSRKPLRSNLDASNRSMSQSSVSLTSYSSRGKKKKKRMLQEIGPRKSKKNLAIETIADTREEADDSNYFDIFQRKGKFYKRTKFIIVLTRVYKEQSQR